MKKLFLLIPAFLLSLAVSATEIHITPTSPHSSGSNLLSALTTATDGDVIILADGTYNESSNYIIFDKDVEVRAAEAASPIVKFAHYIKVGSADDASLNNKNISIQGITFDGSAQGDTREQVFRIYGVNNLEFTDCKFTGLIKPGIRCESGKTANLISLKNCDIYNNSAKIISNEGTMNSISIDGCEFTNNSEVAIYSSSSAHVGACTITNSKFHDFAHLVVNINETTSSILSVTNCTFANIDASTISGSIVCSNSASGKVTVDHCTFYNCPVKDSSYGTIKVASTDATVSNNILVLSASTNIRAIHMPDGREVKNCLTYRYTYNTDGIRYGVTKTNCINSDPLFMDPENGDFSYPGDWTSSPVSVSPARGASTDKSDLGDKQWYTPETVSSTDFATPYAFIGEKALLTGNISLNANNSIAYSGASTPGIAAWKIHVNNRCALTGIVDMETGSSSGCTLKLIAFNEEGNKVDSLEAPYSGTDADINIPGSMYLPTEGDYTFKLYNGTGWSSAKVESISLSLSGGAVQNLPGTTNINDSWFSSNGTRTAGAINYSSVSNGCWAKWNIHINNTAWFNVTTNIKGQYGHQYSVEFLKEGEITPIIVTKGVVNYTNNQTFYANDLGLVKLEAGNYEMKVCNSVGDASLISVTLAYSGGNVTNIATDANTSLDVADAWFEGCTRGADRIVYPSSGTSSAWIKWNIAATETKFYDLTLNINAPNAHGFTAALYEDESASPVASVTEGSYVNTAGVLALELGRVNLVGGKNYVVKLTNAPEGSVAEVLDLTFAPVVASSTALPNTLNFSNAVLSPKAHITNEMLYFNTIGDTDPRGQWAQWEVTTDHNGLFLFTMGVASTSQQSYKITIKDNSENELEYFEANPGSGNQTIKHYFALNAGTYFVKVENTYSYSKGHLTSLAVTEPAGVVTIDENATDNSTWSAKVGDNNTYDVQIIRSFKGGMNNTFCLPFGVSSSQCKEVFGNDVEIRTLDEATIEEGNFVLNLNFVTTTSIYQGTPVLIKPARDIVNPVFTGVEFKKTASEPTTKTNADFVGSFVKTPLSASDNLLYVGPENKVFFLSVDYDMPGMRAWFEIHDVPAALGSPKALRSARIIEKEQITTSILNVETSGDAARKVLYNGQIVIIRGNEMYNMQGQHIQ